MDDRAAFRIFRKENVDTESRRRVNLSVMGALTTVEAADEAGVTVRQWHYWTDKLGIEPLRQLSGPRGAKFWGTAAVRKVSAAVAEVAA